MNPRKERADVDFPALIAALKLDAAPSDTARASVLEALKVYGQESGQPALVEAAQAAMPQAHPWEAPAEWRGFYLDHFRMTADTECGVDPDEAERYCGEYWSMNLTDAQRQERLANPRLGERDGEQDAQNLNDA
jgi:hypothetical protein